MIILDGKKLNYEIASSLRKTIKELGQNVSPHLMIIKIGDDDASDIYVERKIEFGYNIGAQMTLKKFKEDVEEKDVINFIEDCNSNSDINGILVQLPISKHLDQTKILDAVVLDKDVDGISSQNLSRMREKQEPYFIPVPVKGILTLLQKNNIEINEKKVVVINDSNLIGKPSALLFSSLGADVVVCNEKTERIKEITKTANILITAIGKPEIINDTYLSDGQTVVDVGISYTDRGIMGDVKKDIKTELVALTPVPGGVGPMTVASLFQNLVDAYKMQQK